MTDPEKLLEEAQELAHREVFIGTGCSVDDKKAAAEKARGLIGDALELYRSSGDRTGEAKALRRRGYLESMVGQWEDARRALAKSLEIARNAADRNCQAKALRGAGLVELVAENWKKAREFLAESVQLFIELDNREETAQAQSELAWALRETGDAEAAIRVYQEAHENAAAAGDMHTVSRSLTSQANIYREIGFPERANEMLDKALELSRGCDDALMALAVLVDMSLVDGAFDRFPALQEDLDAAMAEASKASNQRG